MTTLISKEEFEDIKSDPNRTVRELRYTIPEVSGTDTEVSGTDCQVTVLCTEKMVASKTITTNGVEYASQW